MTLTPTTLLLPNDVVDRILDGLKELDEKFIEQTIKELTEENFTLTGSSAGFLFGGTFFTDLPAKHARVAKKVPLDPSLHERGQELAKAVKEFDNDLRFLKQGLKVLLRECSTAQDFRDALPNAIKMVLPELNGISRTREVAYTLQDKPFLIDQFHALEDRLHYYLSKRLLN